MSLSATIVTTAPFFPPASGGPATEQQLTVKSLENYFPCLVVVNFLDLAQSVNDVTTKFDLQPAHPDGITIELDFEDHAMSAGDKQYRCEILQDCLFRWCRCQGLRVDLRVVPA